MLHICNFIEYSEKCFLRSFELKKKQIVFKRMFNLTSNIYNAQKD